MKLSPTKLDNYRAGLATLSREELELVCVEHARRADSLMQRSGYWMKRSERAEAELAKRFKAAAE